ncbi:MAG TPA: penicillin-binding protein 1A, partial [Bacillota bacterium]|nr:penicillin-binding protein 1A [Bacillota bacterium]
MTSVHKKPSIVLGLIVILSLIMMTTGCGRLKAWTSIPNPNIVQASKLLDYKGREVASLYSQNRVPVKLGEISPYMLKAIVAVEDVRFYQHKGLDPISIFRAVVADIKAGALVEGGSTITQQTAKNLYLTQEKTFLRKIREAILTIQLERKYSKDEILLMYLNQIYFGHGAYGVEIGAQTYFAKPAKDLSLAESAMLAGIPKGPNIYSPFKNLSAAKERQALVLKRMVTAGQITPQQAEKAKKQTLVLATSRKIKTVRAPYFVDEVRQYITEKYEDGAELLKTGGLSVYTSLDLDIQNAAESAFSNGLKGQNPNLQGALVAIDPQTGYIKAMVGGRDYKSSKFNRAYAKRQPGSAFKPFTYAAALETGYTAGSVIMCQPVSYRQQEGNDYRPQDYGNLPYHYRNFTFVEALAKSDNVVAVQLNQQTTPQRTIEYARKLGITSSLRPYLSLVLGTSEVTPLEMASAYGGFATQGNISKPLMVIKIVDKSGRILEENKTQVSQALDPKTAYIITDMLKSVLNPGGTAGSLSNTINRPAAGKTGTTQNYRDAWFVGYTPELSTAIYIGYDIPRSTGQTGGGLAAPIWGQFINEALANTPASDFTQPGGLVRVKICSDTGKQATVFSP